MRRLEGVPSSAWSSSMLDAVQALRPPSPPAAGRARRAGGHAALEAFAVHPDLAGAFFTFNRHVLWGTSLAPRLRHIIILRIAARRQASFLWSEHVPAGLEAGLSEDEIACIRVGGVETFTPLERSLVQAADDLIDDGEIGDVSWRVLVEELIPPQLLDVVFTAGCYETVAWMMNTVGLEAKDD